MTAIGCARMTISFLSEVMLQSPHYIIDAFWDMESGVWVATSDEVLGLATEAQTIEQLTQKLHVMIPELIQANQLLPADYQGTIQP
jgi:predicted RNase H-like HicB family nuclease